jgi:hypothetical protein
MLKLANNYASMNKVDQLEHFVLYLHITPGIVHDFEETVKALKDSQNRPIIVVVIQIKEQTIDEYNQDAINVQKIFDKLSNIQRRNRRFVSLFQISPTASNAQINDLMMEIRSKIFYDFESYINKYRFEIANSMLVNES